MTTFHNYRFPNGSWETNLKAAIKDHYKRFEALPPRIRVNPKNLVETQNLAQKLQLEAVKIEASGGCQSSEIWLEV